ncbi:hypothetical protein FHX77_000682 [Bifidobacterium commune]|uniref:Uncharacterized protein n=1 Tax=Bifidobacterium commune TaxID=1505727 RepID=A0A1C4GZE2_9BIFI|nr:hypothetical protein [Bifidobacterium commune]MBB2955279.1 hypothetical protein [Bifidobacterium commune]SCC78021.1 hypothetical protein GA0061077_0064 [Bifidobacterium commune]
MDQKTLVEKLSKVTTISEVLEVTKEAGKSLTVEQGDMLLQRLFKAENDTGKLMGDSVEKAIKEFFG